jgi:hypothetical protein
MKIQKQWVEILKSIVVKIDFVLVVVARKSVCVATIPLAISLNNLFSGCLNFANALPLCIPLCTSTDHPCKM